MFATRFDVSSSETAAKVSKKAQLLKKLKNKNNTTDNNVAKVESVKLNKDTEGDITMVDTEVEDKNMKEEKYEKNKVNMDIDDTDDEKNELKRKRDSTSDSDPDSDSDSDSDLDSDSDSAAEEDIGHEGYEQSSVTDADDTTPHTSVLSRFKKAMINQSETHTGEEEEINEAGITEFKDVAPLPQLKLPRDRQLYSQSHKNNSLDWLTKPAYYDSNMTKSFKEFNPTLHKIILKNLNKDFQIENAFSVQITLIQELLQDINRGKFDPTPRGDYLINAATGSGKTLSYLIPIVQYILGTNDEIRIKDAGIQCVIIVPTKPLVHQVYSDALKLTKGTDINVMALKSGGDMSINEERLKLESNLVDILIATPGRLVEHLNSIETTCLRFLVVDEADRLLNQNFQDWCDLLMNKIERNSNIEDESMDFYFKQRCIKIVLSATLTTNSAKLTHLRLFKPRLVIVNTDNTNELYQLPRSLDEKYLRIPEKLSYFKPLILLKFFQWVDKIGNRYDNFGLIFTKSNESSIRLNNLLNSISERFGLQDKICINTINSMMDNQERSKILKRFDENGGILICTDLLSRGINLNSIKFVINYDLPTSTKEYIHRIGRTARAGNFGSAVTLCYGEGEFKWFKKVVYSGQQINRNGKKLVDIKFVKEINSEEDDKEDESVDNFELNLTDSDKEVYEACLKNLV